MFDHQVQDVLLANKCLAAHGRAARLIHDADAVSIAQAVQTGVVVRGRGGDASEECSFAEGQFIDRLVEISLSGGLGADVAVGVRDGVEVPGEDLVLGVVTLDLDGDRDFL